MLQEQMMRLRSWTTTTTTTKTTTSIFHKENNTIDLSSRNVSPIQFIFVVGLEGTGHHLHQRIVQASPAYYRIRHALNDYQKEIKELHASLFNRVNGTGLWNLPCNKRWTKKQQDIDKERRRRQEHVAFLLKRIFHQVPVTTKPLHFPVNTLSVDRRDTMMYGMSSYPNWSGPCRAQQYPRLSWFYEACAMASVDCRHLYLYRDPLDSLYSTTIHRPFNTNLSQGIALYESIVHDSLIPDLTKYSNHSLGCVGFYSDDDNEDWKSTLPLIWQWKNRTKFLQEMDKVYKKPAPRQIPEELLSGGILMDRWQLGHDHLMELCRKQQVTVNTS